MEFALHLRGKSVGVTNFSIQQGAFGFLVRSHHIHKSSFLEGLSLNPLLT